MNNEIILRSVYGKVNQIYFIQPCPNPKTGKLPDCIKTIDSHGDMRLSESDVKAMSEGTKHFIAADHVFEIVDGTSFDLDDVVDRANWEAIEHCNWIAQTRKGEDGKGNVLIEGNANRYGVADLYVDRPGEIAKARVTRKQQIHKACAYIYEDTDQNRIKKAKVLGRDLKNAIPADVLDYLIETSEKDPKKIINLYESEDWKQHLFILDAIDRGVIRKLDGIYKYDDKMIGGSMPSVIAFMKDIKYKKMVGAIKKETYPELSINK